MPRAKKEVAELEELRTQFTNARDEQMGDKRGTRRAARCGQRALELQLADNLRMLAKEYKGQPEAEFFTQSLLEDPTQSDEPEPPPA